VGVPGLAAPVVSRHVLALYFGWPAGAVYSNLIASVICAGVVWWRVKARMIAHHLEQVAQRERHHLEQLAQRAEHHEELKAHVTEAVAAVPRPAARRAKTLVTDPHRKAGP